MSYRQYSPRTGKLSKAEKERRAKTRKRNKILKEWHRTSDLYEYDSVPFNAYSAMHIGLDVYWSICSNGHIGEFTLKGACKQCRAIHRSVRDARIRGTKAVNLTRKEKSEIGKIYAHAKHLAQKTGEEHHVDHIRPLVAGGEHHPSNLQVITAKENLAKGGKFNGIKKEYSRIEKKERSEQLAAKRDEQLNKVYEGQFNQAMEEYQSRTFLGRLFNEKPKLKRV